jgi:threonine dehydratase
MPSNVISQLRKLDSEVALERIKKVINRTPLQYAARLSEQYEASIYLKREDLQVVRSYKLRGAFNKISQMDDAQLQNGVVGASAGNHAQGLAFSCKMKGIKGVIFMPKATSKQKIEQTKMFGGAYIQIVLVGDTFDDCLREALQYTEENKMTFIPPFDDLAIIEGQGSVGVEVLQDLADVDVLVLPIGGGGLAAGVSYYVKQHRPEAVLIGAEPEGAGSMKAAIAAGAPVTLDKLDPFVDGAAVKRAGDYPFEYCSQLLDKIVLVPEGRICTSILRLYNNDAIVAEPAGALSIAALNFLREDIKGKKVVCIISGGNNDIDRMQEIKERSLLYEGLKYYFIVHFPQHPGALKRFVNEVLGPEDDITRFEFIKKNQRERGPALVGIELRNPDDHAALLERMRVYRFDFREINSDPVLFEYII